MPPDSWIAPDDVAACAADAIARIDGTLSRLTEADRDAFWASVRKCYNTPYNDPKPRALPRAQVPLAEPAAREAPRAPPPVEPAPLSALAAAVLATLPGAFTTEPHAA